MLIIISAQSSFDDLTKLIGNDGKNVKISYSKLGVTGPRKLII